MLALYFAGIVSKSNAFTQLSTSQTETAITYFHRGVEKAELGDYEEAIADLDVAIALDPQYSEAYYLRGVAKYQLGNYEAAIADFNQTIEIYPISDVYYYRGLAYMYI